VRTHYLVTWVIPDTIGVVSHSPKNELCHLTHTWPVWECRSSLLKPHEGHHVSSQSLLYIVHRDFCLKIINFDLVMLVNNKDEVVNAG
jgi:hypothetical protein